MSASFPHLTDFLSVGYTPYHVVVEVSNVLREQGYHEIKECDSWILSAGEKYYFTRGGSALIAFRVPKSAPVSFQLAIAHTDSPCFKIKSAQTDGEYVRLSVEKYGGMMYGTWYDRPLRVAGRVFANEGGKVIEKNVCLDRRVVIPSLAIHHNRDANEKVMGDMKTDLLPVFSLKKDTVSFMAEVAQAAGVEEAAILGQDLFIVSDSAPFVWGEKDSLISSPRLDDLQSVYGLLGGFLAAEESGSVPVLALLDAEEVGSTGASSADSDILTSFVKRVAASVCKDGEALPRLLASSFALSCDSAHAVHPAHPEVADTSDGKCYINGGIVIKETASKRYVTDGFSAAMLRVLCTEASVPAQRYRNRADMPGGATLGNVALSHLSVPVADIGLATLAMHSALETAGITDVNYLVKLAAEYFSSTLIREGDGFYWKRGV